MTPWPPWPFTTPHHLTFDTLCNPNSRISKNIPSNSTAKLLYFSKSSFLLMSILILSLSSPFCRVNSSSHYITLSFLSMPPKYSPEYIPFTSNYCLLKFQQKCKFFSLAKNGSLHTHFLSFWHIFPPIKFYDINKINKPVCFYLKIKIFSFWCRWRRHKGLKSQRYDDSDTKIQTLMSIARLWCIRKEQQETLALK